MPTFEIIDLNKLASSTRKRVKRRGFLQLLNVAANRWMEGLPIRVLSFKK